VFYRDLGGGKYVILLLLLLLSPPPPPPPFLVVLLLLPLLPPLLTVLNATDLSALLLELLTPFGFGHTRGERHRHFPLDGLQEITLKGRWRRREDEGGRGGGGEEELSACVGTTTTTAAAAASCKGSRVKGSQSSPSISP